MPGMTDRLLSDSQGLLSETASDRTIRSQVMEEAGPRTLTSVMGSLDTAGARATGAFNAAEGTLGREQRAIGGSMTPEELASQQRRLGLGRALSTVDARNREVGAMRHRTTAARQASMGLRDLIDSQVMSGRAAVAGAETAREREYEAAKAEHKSKKNAMLGTLAGVALSFVPGGMFLAPAVSGAIANRG